MDNNTVAKELGVPVSAFYKYMHTNQQKFSYAKKNNPDRCKDMVTAGIINFYGIEHNELLAILKLYKMQQKIMV